MDVLRVISYINLNLDREAEGEFAEDLPRSEETLFDPSQLYVARTPAVFPDRYLPPNKREMSTDATVPTQRTIRDNAPEFCSGYRRDIAGADPQRRDVEMGTDRAALLMEVLDEWYLFDLF